MTVDDAGNLTANGNILSSSDARFKTDWMQVDVDYVKKLAKVKSGTYTHKKTNARQAGVSAQSLKRLLPESVCADDRGHLSVAYGQAALVSVIELAKEVVALRKEVAALRKQIVKLEKRK
jgi:hypothetical protein